MRMNAIVSQTVRGEARRLPTRTDIGGRSPPTVALQWTTAAGATSHRGVTTPFEVLFSITLYRDGRIRISGKPRRDRLPEILRMVAEAIETGATVLDEEGG